MTSRTKATIHKQLAHHVADRAARRDSRRAGPARGVAAAGADRARSRASARCRCAKRSSSSPPRAWSSTSPIAACGSCSSPSRTSKTSTPAASSSRAWRRASRRRAITDDEIRELTDLHHRMLRCAMPEELPEYRELNRRFHATIFNASRRSYLIRTLAQLWAAFPTMLWSNIPLVAQRSTPGRDEPDAAEHEAIVRALAARDPDAAELRRRAATSRPPAKALLSALRATSALGTPPMIRRDAQPLKPGPGRQNRDISAPFGRSHERQFEDPAAVRPAAAVPGRRARRRRARSRAACRARVRDAEGGAAAGRHRDGRSPTR